MKFLCVACDKAMKLQRTLGPREGSMTVVFSCPRCGRETAMLTNAMETQMVRALGVEIGGKRSPAAPMEMVRASLSQGRGDGTASVPTEHEALPGKESGSKCPFTGMVADAFAQHEGEARVIVWTREAEARLERVPPFAQPMVKKGVEMHALEHGYTEINDAVMDEVKGRFGM